MTASVSRRSSTSTLTDPIAAATLLSPAERRYLDPFVGRERSTAEVARELGESVERTAYRVRRMVDRGLLHPVRTVARKGRGVVVYAAADEIRAPLSLLPSADIAHLFDVMDAGGRSAFLGALAAVAARRGVLEWEVRVRRSDDDRHVLVDMVSPETEGDPALLGERAPAVAFHWVPVAMDEAAAKHLQHRLADLVAGLPVSTGEPTHLVGVFLTPLPV